MSGGRTFKVIFDGELSPAFQASVAAAGGKIEEVGKKTTSTGDQIVKAMQVGSVAVSGAGVAIEALARKQQAMNVEAGQTAAAIGISTEAFRDMATSIANAGLPLSELVPLLKLANQEGLQGESALKAYANFWDDVGDATGLASVELAKMSTGLRAVGVSAGNESQALASFGFITDHTKVGVDDFLSLLQKKGAHLHEFGISIDDTAAILGVMEHSLGLTGKAAATELASGIDKSDGSLASLLRTIGITNSEFEAMRAQVDASSGVIERNAKIQDDTITSTERWKEKIDEFLFSHASMVKSVSDFAPIMLILGPAVNGVAAAYKFLGTSAGAAAIGMAAPVAGAAALTIGIHVLGSKLDQFTNKTYGATEAQRRFEEILNGGKTPAEQNAAAMKLLSEATKSYDDITDGIGGHVNNAFTALGHLVGVTSTSEQEFNKLSAEVKEAAIEMVKAGNSTEQLKAAQDKLPPQLRSIFDAAVRAAGGYQTAGANAVVLAHDTDLATASTWNLLAAMKAVAQLPAPNISVFKQGQDPFGVSAITGAISGIASRVTGGLKGDIDGIIDGVGFYGAGGGGGGGGGSKAAEQIVQSFGESIVQALQGLELEKEFGSTGERAMVAFGEALADPKKSAALGPAIASLIKEAESAGVPNAMELGANLINAVGDGLQTGDWASVYAAMHPLADALGEAGVASRKALTDIAKDQADLATAFANTEKGISAATTKEQADLAALASSHQENLQKIQASLEQAKADFAEAAAARRADYAEAKQQRADDAADALATRHADAADALATRHQDAADALEQRHADSADKLAQLAADHEDKLAQIKEQETAIVEGGSEAEVQAKLRAQQKAADAARKAEDKKYDAAVAAEAKRLAKADADAAKALAKQDEQAAKAQAKQDAAAEKALAKQEAAAARAQAKADEAAATAERKKEAALTISIDAENKKFADQQIVILKRYADELKALQDSYAEKELAANKHMAAMAKIAGLGGGMLPVTIDWSIPAPANSPAMRWDSANQRWVDTGHMPLPGYAVGTPFVPQDGPAYLHRGEAVIPAAMNRGGMGGVTVNIHGDWHASDDAKGRITQGDISYFLDRNLRAIGMN